MVKTHHYAVTIEWTGNNGVGTRSYNAYSRDHAIHSGGKPVILGSSDPAFRGDPTRWNPEDLLVAAASACHKLWWLHLCADAGIVVLAYRDQAEGVMVDTPEGGRMTEIHLRPHCVLAEGADRDLALRLHDVAHEKCTIAQAVNFPVLCASVCCHASEHES